MVCRLVKNLMKSVWDNPFRIGCQLLKQTHCVGFACTRISVDKDKATLPSSQSFHKFCAALFVDFTVGSRFVENSIKQVFFLVRSVGGQYQFSRTMPFSLSTNSFAFSLSQRLKPNKDLLLIRCTLIRSGLTRMGVCLLGDLANGLKD